MTVPGRVPLHAMRIFTPALRDCDRQHATRCRRSDLLKAVIEERNRSELQCRRRFSLRFYISSKASAFVRGIHDDFEFEYPDTG
jgi:phosphopantetheine adenylyltransferase